MPSEFTGSESQPSEQAASEMVPSEASPSESARTKSGEVLAVPFAVTIDNQRNARPQSGLPGAHIVIETLAEGGITRYFAIFDHDPGEKIGPIRSTRIYFNRMSHLWNLPLVHMGGNADALTDWTKHETYNVDGIYTNGGAFVQDPARKRPHATYTDANRIETVLKKRSISPTVPSYELAAAPNAKITTGVRIHYMGEPEPYTVEWRPAVNGRWERYIAGEPDKDSSGATIEADNVLVVVAPVKADNDPYTPGSIDMDWTKPGAAWLFRNGQVATGTWNLTAQAIIIKDSVGRSIGFTSGNLWVEVVPTADEVTLLGAGSSGAGGQAGSESAGGDSSGSASAGSEAESSK